MRWVAEIFELLRTLRGLVQVIHTDTARPDRWMTNGLALWIDMT